MRLDPPNTLAYYLSAPQRKSFNLGKRFSAAQLKAPVSASKTLYSGGIVKANPDFDAAVFYALNQVMAVIQRTFTEHEELPTWAVNLCAEYISVLAEQNIRMFHYMLLITTRESRHLHGMETFFAGKGKELAPQFKTFLTTLSGAGSDGAVSKFLHSAPDIPLTTYVDGLTTVFNTGTFSGGYGGKKWGQISATLGQYARGDTSGEILIDTAYTLSHNNGPIFNKGMYYNQYSHDLLRILDVQRSGQVAELLIEGKWFQDAITTGGKTKPLQQVIDLLVEGRAHLGIGSYVDWQKVEDLGSLQKYPEHKAYQTKTYGNPAKAAEKVAPPPAPEKPVITLFNGLPAKFKGTFTILPGKTVSTYERIKAL